MKMNKNNPEIVNLIVDESFQRWLSGVASEAEADQWKKWLNESSEHRTIDTEARNLWQDVKFRTSTLPDIDAEWQRLETRLNIKTTHNISDYEVYHRVKRRSVAPAFSRWWQFGAIVSVVIGMLVLIFNYHAFFNFNKNLNKEEFQAVSTEYGQRATVNLPDATKIILNANSTLKYPAEWLPAAPRRFELIGEAYFDVAKLAEGASREFVVYTKDGTVKVTGTRFAVYQRGKGTRIVVEEGRVEVASGDSRTVNTDSVAKVYLKPGQLLKFRKGDKALQPRNVNIQPYTTWWHNQIVLQRTPFKEIVQRLEETYGVEVKVIDKKLLGRTLSGSIENHNLVTVTDALANALKVPVRREGQQIIFGDSSVKTN